MPTIALKIARAAAVILTFVTAQAFAVPAFAQTTCAYNSTQATCACPTTGSGVTCFGGQLFRSTDASCQNDPRGTASCASTQRLNCNTVACECLYCPYTGTGSINGCSAAWLSTVGASCTGTTGCPTNGVFTTQCNGVGCAGGQVLCALSNSCVSNSCSAGLTYDPATCTCSADVKLNPAGPQTGYFAVTNNAAPALPVVGAMYYDTGLNKFRCYQGSPAAWADCGGGGGGGTLPTGPGLTNNTLRHDGTSWVANGVLRNFGTSVEVATTSTLPNDIGNGFTLRRTLDATSESTGFGTYLRYNLGGNVVADIIGRITSGSPWRSGGLSFHTQDPSGLVERVRIGMVNPGNGIAPFLPALSIGNGTIAAGFSVDLRNTWDAGTAIMNVSNENATRLWTGFRMARGAPSAERWFLGMNATDDAFRIRRTVGGVGTDNLVVDATGKVAVVSLQVTGGVLEAGRVLTSDASGNATWQAAAAGGGGACGGRQFLGFTGAFTGNLNGGAGGYDNADARCNAVGGALAGSKVCTAEEMLNSYKCNAAGNGSPVRTAGNNGPAWVNVGPPGYTAWSNDCNSWKNAAPSGGISYFGRVWELNATDGGRGTMTVCTASIRFACCK